MSESTKKVQRVPAEVRFAEELRRLAETDSHEVPPGWRLSPIAVERFIDGAPELGIARSLSAKVASSAAPSFPCAPTAAACSPASRARPSPGCRSCWPRPSAATRP